jgi:hypothetical protein
MNVKRTTSLWLIRIYAVIVALVVITDMLEGGAFKLIVTIAVALIIFQTYVLGRSNN